METLILEPTRVLDRQALIGIYEHHSAPLFRYAFRLLGDRELAEDCVSETFSRFLGAVRHESGPIDNVQAYLYRVAHNWVTDYYRRRPRAPIPLDVELSAGEAHTPQAEVAATLERERVRQALLRLPSDQRQVIELRFLEEWPHEAVATALGKSVEATRALQHRALEHLRRLLLASEAEVRPAPADLKDD